jgi:hypothetical protein
MGTGNAVKRSDFIKLGERPGNTCQRLNKLKFKGHIFVVFVILVFKV